MAKYKKKPVVIETEIYKPGMEDGFRCNVADIAYCNENICILSNGIDDECGYRIPVIKTLEGYHEISKGDYIITGVKGERYPCKPDIFHMTYERVEG